jgi:kynurenine 3-monooxygenase
VYAFFIFLLRHPPPHLTSPQLACWDLFGLILSGGRGDSIEMRHDVTTLSFRLRKKIDNLLYKWGGKEPETLTSLGPRFHKDVYPSAQPRGWMPLYTMVTFRPDVGYAAAKTKAERQTRILNAIGIGAGFFGVVSVVALAYHRLHGRRW